MNVTEIYLEHVSKISFSDFTEEEIRRAKYRLIDSMGVIAVSVNGAGNQMAYQLITDIGGRNDATILRHGRKCPAHNAAFLNSLIMRSWDFEVVEAQANDGKSTPAHISGTSVPVALAMAEWKEANGEKMLTAMLLGEDLAARLAGSGLCNPFTSPWDNTGTVNGLGAALIAGYIMDLDQAKLTNALGLAMNQLSGSGGNIFDKAMAYKLPIALAARNGIFSAQLGALGFTALADPITGRAGYYDTFCESFNIDSFLHELGQVHLAEVVIKPYAACRATHPSIDAALAIREKHNPDPDRIAAVHVQVPPLLIGSFVDGDYTPGATPQIAALFNLKYNVAAALLFGSIHPENNASEKTSDPALSRLLSRITIAGDEGRKGASVTVETAEGERFTEVVTTALGDWFQNPLTQDQIIEKYYKNVAFAGGVSPRSADKAIQFIMDLERQERLSPLIDIFS
jgi:2-methylcitrate dehydratase PrpD